MDVSVGILHLLKLGAKLVGHRIQQYRLTTNETVVRETNYGQVRGVKRYTIYNEQYYAFEGIPFAKPPINELRFRAPQPPESWQNILDCTNCANKPLQKQFVLGIIEGSEDCLYLNVYAKQLDTAKPLPVMVWFYGGGFEFGEATRDVYAPDYFMNEQILLVTINYRLGALGFLSLADPDLDVPGNAGLKDQVMALRWIKENIGYFNGDENNITLFGNSAGAASTHFMMLTDKAKGLFHKAIMQSGSSLNSWAHEPHLQRAFRLANSLGYNGSNNDKEILRYLAKVDGKKIVQANTRLLSKEEKCEHVLTAFGPTIEPYITADCVIPKPYVEMQRTAWSNDIPLIIGGASFEGLFSYQRALYRPYVVNEMGSCEIMLPEELRSACNAAELKEMALKLKCTHFGDKEPSVKETLYQYFDLISYKYFWHGMHRTLLARQTYARQAPTYLYRFDFDSPFFNHFRILTCGPNVRGVNHGDDISYLFYNIAATKLPADTPEYKTIERMIGMWTAFALSSNPNCPSIAPAVWDPVHSDTNMPAKCLNISEKVQLIELPETEKLKVWDSFYKKEDLF